MIGHGAQGAALARDLAAEGIRTRADLRRRDVLARLPRGAQASVVFNPRRGVPLAEAQEVAAEVRRRARFVLADGTRLRPAVIPVGSVRRKSPRVKDLDFVIILPPAHVSRLPEVLSAFSLSGDSRSPLEIGIATTYAGGARRHSLILRARPRGAARWRYYRSDLFLATAAEKPFALFHHTGSAQYNIRTRAHAKRSGWLLNQYGIFEAGGARRPVPGSESIRTERDLARFLGVSFRAPAARDSDARVVKVAAR